MNYITIGTEKYPVKWGFRALAEFGELAEISLAEMTNPAKMSMQLSLEKCIKMCWVGLKHGAKAAGEPLRFKNWEELADVLDNPELDSWQVLKATTILLATDVVPPKTQLDEEKGETEQPGKQAGSQ